MPKCIQIRLIKISLLFMFVAVISVIAAVLSHNAIDISFGAVICSGGGIYVFKVCVAVRHKKVCIFEGVCIGANRVDEIGNFARSVLTGGRGYTLQGEGKTVEFVSQGSLYLHTGQKYRFYLPEGSLTGTEGKNAIRLHQFYGFEMIT